MEWRGEKDISEFLQDYEKIDDYKMSLSDELKGEIWNAQEKSYKERQKSEKSEDDKKEQKLYFKQMKLF